MLPHVELVLRLVIAAGLGSLIGFERERLQWAAGLRTHMLVCVGSCLIMIVSAYGFDTILGPNVVLDPSRVAAQVVSGIGFLGAGSILLRGELIKGLTTAASLWTVAGIGLAVGGGLYIESTAATVIVLTVLVGLKPLERWYQRRQQTLNLRLTVARGKLPLQAACKALGWQPSRFSRFIVSSTTNGTDQIELSIKKLSMDEMEAIIRKLQKLPSVRRTQRM